MTALLDVNVLIALLDPDHAKHDEAHAWFAQGPSARLTDSYLLALAVKNRGRLVTFDSKLSPDAVVGGREALVML